jgi:hypothetical protein
VTLISDKGGITPGWYRVLAMAQGEPMKYTTEKLESIAAKLRDLPPPDKRRQEYSKQAAVGVLIREITALQKRGYTLVQIAEALRGEGLDIASSTLKTYLLRTKPERKAPAPRTASTSSPLAPTAGKQANDRTSATRVPVKQVVSKRAPVKQTAMKQASFPIASDTDDI